MLFGQRLVTWSNPGEIEKKLKNGSAYHCFTAEILRWKNFNSPASLLAANRWQKSQRILGKPEIATDFEHSTLYFVCMKLCSLFTLSLIIKAPIINTRELSFSAADKGL